MIKVVSYAQLLAVEQGADVEICELAALLHDIAQCSGNTDSDNDHHIIGAEIAGKLLKELDYPDIRAERVLRCIVNHRGSVARAATSLEEQIIKDADAIAHFDAVSSLFKVAYLTLGLDDETARKWVVGKLPRGWDKISAQAKKHVRDKRVAVELLFGETLRENVDDV